MTAIASKLEDWRQLATGQRPIVDGCKNSFTLIHGKTVEEIEKITSRIQQLVAKAMEDLQEAKQELDAELLAGSNKVKVTTNFCVLTDMIDRVIRTALMNTFSPLCLDSVKLTNNLTISELEEIRDELSLLTDANDADKKLDQILQKIQDLAEQESPNPSFFNVPQFFFELLAETVACRKYDLEFKEKLNRFNILIQEIDSLLLQRNEFSREEALGRLQSMDPSTPAIKALIGDQGILSKPILMRTLNIYSEEVMERSLKNSGLNTAEDLHSVFQNSPQHSNILATLRQLLKLSRENAVSKMSSNSRHSYLDQWTPDHRVFISDGKICPSNYNLLDAQDFLLRETYNRDFNEIKVYQGQLGDFYVVINKNPSVQEALGNNNYTKLKRFDNYLWSSDGKTFYLLDGNEPSFKTKDGDNDNVVNVKSNGAYATANHAGQKYTYERANHESVISLLDKFRTGVAEIIPYRTAKKPEYLFQKLDGQYIYVDDSWNVFFCDGKGKPKEQKVKNYDEADRLITWRARDGGTTQISLENGGKIFSPSPFETNQSPKYTDANGQEHPLTKMHIEKFDFQSIGIELEPKDRRHTMVDLYRDNSRN